MGRMSKTRAQYRISQRVKYVDTAPELAWDAFCIQYLAPKGFVNERLDGPLELHDKDEKPWSIRPDRRLSDGKSPYTYVELDGHYHRTLRQERKTEWRDGLIVSQKGARVLHVDSELLTTKKWWFWLVGEVLSFWKGGDLVHHIYA